MQTILEAAGDRVAVELASNEDKSVEPLLIGVPRATGPSLEVHLDPLKQESVRIAAKVENAVRAKHVGPELGDQRAEPQTELHAIQAARLDHAYRHDVAQVVVMAMMSVSLVVAVVVLIMMVVVVIRDGGIDFRFEV